MKARLGIRLGLALLAPLGLARHAGAQDATHVQISPFAGLQYGGSLEATDLNTSYGFESGLAYGGTLDVPLNETFRAELLYSRQSTKLGAGSLPSYDVDIEHYMGGIEEEKGEKDAKGTYFGTLLFGATRFIGRDPLLGSLTKPALSLSLGLKFMPARNVGVRVEARGFLTFVESGGGALCANGRCIFNFNGKAFWQGDVTGGLIFAF